MRACVWGLTGVIWTVPASTWVPTQTLTRFPPACEGPDAISHRWYATLQDGVLSLRPAYGHAWPYRPEHPDAPLPALPPLVQLPLDGCEARVVTECFNGPRVWGKRGPVEVRVADGGAGVQGGVGETDRQLLYGETNFYFFAESSEYRLHSCGNMYALFALLLHTNAAYGMVWGTDCDVVHASTCKFCVCVCVCVCRPGQGAVGLSPPSQLWPAGAWRGHRRRTRHIRCPV